MRKPVRWLVLLALAAGVGLAGCDSEQPQKSASGTGKAETKGPPPIPELTAAEKEKWGDHTQDLRFVIGYEKGLELARSHDKPAMMFVTTTWCGWCKRLANENFNDPEVQRLLDSFILVIVDGDTEEDAQRALDFPGGYPYIAFVTPNGEKLGSVRGYRPVKDFKPIVQEALDRARGGEGAI